MCIDSNTTLITVDFKTETFLEKHQIEGSEKI